MAGSLAIAAVIALATGQGDVRIDASLAWDGNLAAASLTELTLSATGDADARVTLETTRNSPVTSAQLDVRQGTAALVSMPVALEPGRRATLRYRIDDGDWQLLDAGRTERRPAVAIVVGDAAIEWLSDMDRVMTVAAADLPRAASTYSHVAAVGIDRNALARLDEAQLRALLEYAGICGRVLLIDPLIRAAELMRQRAGCGGVNFVTSRSRQETRSALAEFIDEPVDGLPDARLLSSMHPDRNADIRAMALYLGGFLLIFLVLTRIRRPRGTHLAFSVMAIVAASLLWGGGNRQSFVAWAEAATTDRVARYASLERATSVGRGDQQLQMQSLERTPIQISGSNLVLYWTPVATDRRFDWTVPVLQEAQVYATGSFPVEPSLRATEKENAVIVCNSGGIASQPAFLRWRQTNYAVPSLSPGAAWQVDEASNAAADAPQLRVLGRRAASSPVTLLQPLQVPGNGSVGRAWLMRAETGAAGESPCSV